MRLMIVIRRRFGRVLPIASLLIGGLGCSNSRAFDDPEPEVHVLYNPTTGKLPLPSDVVRDATAGHLALPIGATDSPAEVEFRTFMNTHDAWPTTTPIAAELSGAVDPKSVSADSVLLFEVGATPRHVTEVVPALDATGTKLSISPPPSGWTRGATYFVAVRGGTRGVRTPAGVGVGADQVFFALRSREPIDTVENNRAFPGATRDERLALATRFEGIRHALAPFFDFVEKAPLSIARDEVAALWSFSVTTSSELAMDPTVGRMPLPFDGLLDPKTKLVALPASPTDTPEIAGIKARLNRMNGFSVAPRLDFELTTAVDPTTATSSNIKVYDTASGREIETGEIRILPSSGSAPCAGATLTDVCTHVHVALASTALPLNPATTYAIVVKDGLRDRDGSTVRPMLMAHFLRAENPLFADGKSLVSTLSSSLAERVEGVRLEVAPLLAQIGRTDVIGVWPFTTLDPLPRLKQVATLAETAALPPEPTISLTKTTSPGLLGAPGLSELSALDTLFEPLDEVAKAEVYVPRLRGVGRVIEGTLASPNTLDPIKRRARDDGAWAREDVHFLMTVPSDASGEVPVVMFGHGMLTDRRFLLTIAGALAKRGFAAIAIDLPFHGERTKCSKIPMLIPNFYPDYVRTRNLISLNNDLLYFTACPEGAECTTEGRCMMKTGAKASFTEIPLSTVTVASGTTMFEFDPPAFVDRIEQAIVDLVSVRRSLASADWSKIAGVTLAKNRVYFAGQSFGATVGASFVSVTSDVERAVFNSPQADLLAMYRESTLFGPITRAVLEYLKLEDGSYQRELILDAAGWIFDAVDPQTLAPSLAKRSAFLQMNKADIVVPNPGTERLQRATKLPMKTYPATLHGALVIPGTGDAMLDDLAESLAGGQIN